MISVGCTLQVQPFPKPYFTFLAVAGMTGTGLTVETALEPVDETEPELQDGGHGMLSMVLPVPILETTKTSSPQSEVATNERRVRAANSREERVGIEYLCIRPTGFIVWELQQISRIMCA